MSFNINDDDGAQALDYNALADRWQYAVISGCGVSINSGTLGQTDTLTVAAGEVLFNGGDDAVASQDVGIDAADTSNPRKDVVYIDSTGTAQVANGAAGPVEPDTATRFESYRPAPPDLSATDAVVLAEVWVPAGASSITASDLRDRRVLADGFFAASGEIVLLGSTGSGAGSPTTTSTTFVSILNDTQNGIVPAGWPQRTGISGYAVSAVLAVTNDTAGETTTVRVEDQTNSTALANTEVTHTGAGRSIHHTPVVTYDPGVDFAFNIQVKVTAGVGGVESNPAVLLWGVRS